MPMTRVNLCYLGDDEWQICTSVEYIDWPMRCKLIVPTDYKFDLASIPRLVWWLIAPFELSILAPLLHDYLYEHKGRLPDGSIDPVREYTRRDADFLFLQAMRHEGVGRWRRTLAYLAVRRFGWIYWNRH